MLSLMEFSKDTLCHFGRELYVNVQILSKDKNMVPLKVAILAAFFVLSEQVLVPSRGQKLVPIAVLDKNMSRLPIRRMYNNGEIVMVFRRSLTTMGFTQK
ncbi:MULTISPECIES: hypothetical protein [unclassified Paenibacillus]|uniref:hypothetical protein n=1 Tax=unclassified Paenibacillus TaxID=185978 RepID=UPI0004665541|nr:MULTISPECIES: hypothetical protein [unclassified Paenibacillus]KGP80273.1 hypothetical protein P363_0130515 [Paenibacillus sp. MAEPY1]KGP80277.1 hypothetical protein P364_0119625 [Paenibacillus sp. MAEPY2]